ncbi:MAG: hypothetical protein ACYC2P_08750 [Paludibacteraceae bacterium]
MKAIRDVLVALLAMFALSCMGVGLTTGRWYFFLYAIGSLIIAYSLIKDSDMEI